MATDGPSTPNANGSDPAPRTLTTASSRIAPLAADAVDVSRPGRTVVEVLSSCDGRSETTRKSSANIGQRNRLVAEGGVIW